METISSTDAARRLGEIFARASRGELFLVTQYSRPFVVIGPPEGTAEAPAKKVARKAAAKKAAPRPRKKSPAPTG